MNPPIDFYLPENDHITWETMKWARWTGMFEVLPPQRVVDAVTNRITRSDFPVEALEVE